MTSPAEGSPVAFVSPTAAESDCAGTGPSCPWTRETGRIWGGPGSGRECISSLPRATAKMSASTPRPRLNRTSRLLTFINLEARARGARNVAKRGLDADRVGADRVVLAEAELVHGLPAAVGGRRTRGHS